MRKEEFLSQLRGALEGKLPPGELEDALSYYEEYFADAGDDREEAAAGELGSPQTLAARLLEERDTAGAPFTQSAPPGAKSRRAPWLIAALALGAGLVIAAVSWAGLFSVWNKVTAPSADTSLVAQEPETRPPAPGSPAPETGTPETAPPAAPAAASGRVDAASGPVTLDALDDFTRVEIELSVGAVVVQEGSGRALALEWLDETGGLRYSVDKGKLRVWPDQSGGAQKDSRGGGVTLTLPAGAELSKLDVTVYVGSAELYGLSAREVDVESNVGSALLRGVSAGELDVSVSVGDATLEDCSASLSLDVESGVGDVEVQGDFPCEVDLECAGGVLRFTTQRGLSEYNYELKCRLGSIQLDGEDRGRRAMGGAGPYELSAECETGDMELHFGA